MRRRCAEDGDQVTARSVTLIEGSVATTFLPFHLAPSGKIFDVTDRYIKIVGRGYVCMWVAEGRPPRGGVCMYVGSWKKATCEGTIGMLKKNLTQQADFPRGQAQPRV